ncbi:MAG: spinster family MFS transporter [Deltaproteobacteria bacterium]
MLTGLNLLNYFDRYLLAAVVPKVQQELHLTDFQAGLVGGAFMVGYCLLSPLFGWLGDRYARRGLISLSVGVWSLTTAGAALARGFGSLFALRAGVGVGEAGYATLSPTIIDDLAPRESTNRWLAIFYVAIPVGSALGYAIGGLLEAWVGWRGAFLAAGLPGLVLAFLALRLPEPERRRSAEVSHHYGRLLRLPVYLMTVVGLMAYTFAVGGFAFWAPKYTVDRYGLSLAHSDLLFGAVTASCGLVGTALGILGQRWPGRTELQRLLRFSGWTSVLAAPLALAAIGFPARFGVAPFLGGLAAAELFLFASTAPINTALLHSVPEELRAGAMAASILAMHLGGDLISPPLLGFAADRVGMHAALFALPAAILLGGLAWLVAARLERAR